jgi:acetoin utilization deacetylase AcuC-like enzyme
VLPFRLVYHERYDLHFGDHVFPSRKFKWLRDRLLRTGFAVEADFVVPTPATDEDLALAHDRAWIEKLSNATLSYQEALQLEVPYSRHLVEGFWLAAGGSTLAARLAIEDGIGFNVGGGFHHAHRDHGEGFCAINDIAVAVRCAQRDGLVRRAMVVDCDVHHGNGTAAIFAGDGSVFTLSIHQYNNYPALKPPSSLDIDLADGVADDEYLDRLGDAFRPALEAFRPELIVYVAGADPYCDDQLGGLSLSLAGLRERDRLVIHGALEAGVPVAIVLAGGYAQHVEDTVVIHANTAEVAKEELEKVGYRGQGAGR